MNLNSSVDDNISLDLSFGAVCAVGATGCPINFMQTTWDMPHDELKKRFAVKTMHHRAASLHLENAAPGWCPGGGHMNNLG